MRSLFYFLMLIPFVAKSQALQQLTLSEVQQMAAANFPLIRQKQLVLQTAQLTIENLQKGILPQINVSGQATYQSEVTSLPIKIPNINIETPSKDQYKIVTDVSQLVYDGGAIAHQSKLQHLNALVEEEKVEVELQKLRERINQLYFGVLLTDEQVKQVSIVSIDLHAGIKRVEGQVQNGTALRSNLSVLQAEQLKNEQRRIELRATRKGLLNILSLFINKTISPEAVLQIPLVNMPSADLSLRSEMRLFQLQDSLLGSQQEFISIKNKPRVSLFAQGGYGRPGLNFLKNDFEFFALGGVRVNWMLGNLYTSKREKELVNINRRTIDVQKDNFVLNTNATLQQQQSEINKMQELVALDEQIIQLREQVKQSAGAQLQNGIITASDFIREVIAAEAARQSLVLHQLQLLQAKINYITTTGNK
ncbi:MAG: TolC family protein [Segetibacter sp.]|nr:TolC family protein [Segetibacter sp.]